MPENLHRSPAPAALLFTAMNGCGCEKIKYANRLIYAEGADRTSLTADERNRNADDQRGTDGVYERAAEYSDREQRTVPSGGDGISEQNEEIGNGIYRLDENGGIGYRETGWEDQRELFERSLNADGQDGALYTLYP